MQKRDFESYQKRFRDFEILPKFSETHVFRGTIRHPLFGSMACTPRSFILAGYLRWKTARICLTGA